jgi:hypothetical protein
MSFLFLIVLAGYQELLVSYPLNTKQGVSTLLAVKSTQTLAHSNKTGGVNPCRALSLLYSTVMSTAHCIILFSIFQYFSDFSLIFLLFYMYYYKSRDLKIT